MGVELNGSNIGGSSRSGSTSTLEGPGGSEFGSRSSSSSSYSTGGNDRSGAGDSRPNDFMGSQGPDRPSKEEATMYGHDRKFDMNKDNNETKLAGQESAQGSKERIESGKNETTLARDDKKYAAEGARDDKKYANEARKDESKAALEAQKDEAKLKLDQQNHAQELEKLKLQQELKNKDDVREHEQFKELAPERDKDRQAKIDMHKTDKEAEMFQARMSKGKHA